MHDLAVIVSFAFCAAMRTCHIQTHPHKGIICAIEWVQQANQPATDRTNATNNKSKSTRNSIEFWRKVVKQPIISLIHLLQANSIYFNHLGFSENPFEMAQVALIIFVLHDKLYERRGKIGGREWYWFTRSISIPIDDKILKRPCVDVRKRLNIDLRLVALT